MDARELSDGSVMLMITSADVSAMREAGDKLCVVPESVLKELSERAANEALERYAEKMEPFLSQKEVARLLGVSIPTVSALAKRGKITVHLVSGRRLYSRRDIMEYKREASKRI